jgi:hypothetical protein
MRRGLVVTILVTQAGRSPVVTPWWALTLLLWGIGAVRRAPTAAVLVLLPGFLLTSCAPPPLTLSPALQARVAALADRLAVLPVDPETGEPGATALCTAWRARVSAPPPAASRPPLWAPDAPEEVSHVP